MPMHDFRIESHKFNFLSSFPLTVLTVLCHNT